MKKRHIMYIAVACGITALLSFAGLQEAQQQRASKRAKVVELLRVTRATEQADAMLKQMTEMLPPEVRGGLRESIDVPTMVRKVIPVYEKYLTEEDIEAMIAFYRSPAGQRILAAQPDIMRDSMIVMKVYIQEQLAKELRSGR